MERKSQKFFAKALRARESNFVNIPKGVSQFFGKKGFINVRGTINGKKIVSTLVPAGKRHKLYISAAIMEMAKIRTGSAVFFNLSLDRRERAVPIPESFKKALEANKRARVVFNKMANSKRKKILIHLTWLRRPQALERNISKIIHSLQVN